jgi:Fe2+ transport system protein B
MKVSITLMYVVSTSTLFIAGIGLHSTSMSDSMIRTEMLEKSKPDVKSIMNSNNIPLDEYGKDCQVSVSILRGVGAKELMISAFKMMKSEESANASPTRLSPQLKEVLDEFFQTAEDNGNEG